MKFQQRCPHCADYGNCDDPEKTIDDSLYTLLREHRETHQIMQQARKAFREAVEASRKAAKALESYCKAS
jgi:hypothetical protein